jgi:hypothetical protein
MILKPVDGDIVRCPSEEVWFVEDDAFACIIMWRAKLCRGDSVGLDCGHGFDSVDLFLGA